METLEEIKQRVEAAVPGAALTIIPNPGPADQPSLLLDHAHAVDVASFLRDDEALRLDYCSNVTGVDWPDESKAPGGPRASTTEPTDLASDSEPEAQTSGYLEAVYHLYSIEHRHGPVILRLRTDNRAENAFIPSLTPVYRAAEFQEREIFDLYGIDFIGHPDQRRILMWDEYEDHPMRKDYVNTDDYEYEPTPHDGVVERATQNLTNRRGADGCDSFGQSESQSDQQQ